ncbi:hypothetical protein [Corynebacterium sp. AOP12-C2-36]|uniref:hypothetical protein n=1 Tax=Corynebacterium sp. AOP12-C2-36 TaxID=3457723 RepID=UPI0040349FCC
MSDLTLGPVVGKIGGAAEPFVFVPDSPSANFSVDLPDGEWAIFLDWEGTSVTTGYVVVNGVTVTPSTTRSVERWAQYPMRKYSGRLSFSTSHAAVNSVTAFPDPTP